GRYRHGRDHLARRGVRRGDGEARAGREGDRAAVRPLSAAAQLGPDGRRADPVPAGGARTLTQQRVIGLDARGVAPDAPATREVKGSTTIVELLRMYPDGEAAKLMSELSLPCAHCGGAFHEPLTMAVQRARG